MRYFTKMIINKSISLLILFLLVLGCSGEKQKAVTVLFTCETESRLEPCGCFAGQFGGIARISSRMKHFNEGLVLKVDAGDSLGSTKDYDLLMYKQALRAFEHLDYSALNLGQNEVALSATQIKEFQELTDTPLVSSNIFDAKTNESLLDDVVIVNIDGLKIAILGVVDPSLATDNLGDGLVVKDMYTSISKSLKKAEDADLKILLAFCNKEQMHNLAKKFFEFDMIIGGNVKQPSQKLELINRSYVLYTTNLAKNLGYVQAIHSKDKGLSKVDFDITMLYENVPQDKEILAFVEDYKKEVGSTELECDKHKEGTEDLVPGVTPLANYVGTETCASCHTTSHEIWKNSPHAKAFKSLEASKSQSDPRCLKCHTVGFNEPSGYKRKFGETKLVNVGCESCHGPGSEHVKQRMSPEKALFKYRPLGEGDCRTCHYGEFSRPFDWKTMWPTIQHQKEAKK
ncbi:MAG: hypothetical protein NE330_21075 [Lentisphaeraceae bacterium]|nr:hypothetical protein [Lentisphaeraceae bacterium]